MEPLHEKCSIIINYTLLITFQWNCIQNIMAFIRDNACENVVCNMSVILFHPQCVKPIFGAFKGVPVRRKCELEVASIKLSHLLLGPGGGDITDDNFHCDAMTWKSFAKWRLGTSYTPSQNVNQYILCGIRTWFFKWKITDGQFHQLRLVIPTFHRQGRCSRGGHLCYEHSEEKYSCSYK